MGDVRHERTLIFIKPDGVQRGLVGEVLRRAVRGWLIDYVSSSPVVAFVLDGIQAVGTARKIVGDTLPFRAAPGTIRGDFSLASPTVANLQRRPVRNMIHASGTVDEAEFEIKMWFRPEELFAYRRGGEPLIQGEYPAPRSSRRRRRCCPAAAPPAASPGPPAPTPRPSLSPRPAASRARRAPDWSAGGRRR